jgi:hypothetical protein
MSSGNKRIVINSRERAVSGDVNRAQAFEASNRAQAMRRQVNRVGHNANPRTYQAVGRDAIDIGVAPTAGTVHDCIHGLMVRPDAAGYLLVDPGSAGFLLAGFSGLGADDSPYIVVDDAGVSAIDVLTFTANAGPGPRIDVIECRPVDAVVESSSRDIYDPVTGLFTPATVEKVRAASLEYRIRTGTPGAGFPGTDPDWMPLAVSVMQQGAASFLQTDFYDVRPLVSERVLGFLERTQATTDAATPAVDTDISARALDSVGQTFLVGAYYGHFCGYRSGGLLCANTPSALARFNDASFGMRPAFEPSHTDNKCGGAQAPVTTKGALNAIVAAFPMGLNRWVRYTQAAVGAAPYTGYASVDGRLPWGPNGILVVGRPATSYESGGCIPGQLPATFGTAVTCQRGQIVGWTLGDGGGAQLVLESAGKSHRLARKPGLLTSGSLTFATLGTADVTAWDSYAVSGDISGLNLESDPYQVPVTAKSLVLDIYAVGTTTGASGTFTCYGPYTAPRGMMGGWATTDFISNVGGQVSGAIVSSGFVLSMCCALTMVARTDPDQAGGPNTGFGVRLVANTNIATVTWYQLVAGWDEY